MAEVCKVETERAISCEPHKFYEHLKYSLHHVPAIFPKVYKDCQILEGDGKSEGSLRQWNYVIPGRTEERHVKARTTKQDDENMVIHLYVEDGNMKSHYKHFCVIVQVLPKGEESTVKWSVEFEKHHDEIPDPHHYLEIFDGLTEKVDAHIHNIVEVCKIETERAIKCEPHKFYEQLKYNLHHLPAIFPKVYKDCKILEGDGKSVGSLRQWNYTIPGSTEERHVKARTTKQDDENMLIHLYVEDGNMKSHYKHFCAIVQVLPRGEESAVKWSVEFEKHHDEIPDPHHYLEIFDGLTEKVDAHIHNTAEVCKVETERAIKCEPHKFYEHLKYSLHHLPAIFPKGYTDAKILEGDGKSVGTLRQWNYILPGTTEERHVKARTTKQDDENMIIHLYVEDGSLQSHYKHFCSIVQVFSYGKESKVKWSVEFEKHHDEIPDPHHYLELFNALIEEVDAHIHNKA